jgi:dihydrofolate reductase
MTSVMLDISMSVDGYVAGPNRSLEQPLGEGALHRWAAAVAGYREMHDKTGATVMGRKMFDGGTGPWDGDPNADGWWKDEPPFHHPVFVLTHHRRARLTKAATTFTFVTDGIESALEQARAVTPENEDVAVAGGADVAQQCLAAGLLDELHIHVLPVILGQGVRLFVDACSQLELDRVTTVPLPTGVTYFRYRVVT